MSVVDVCLEIASDSKNYFGFVVDEFSKRVYTIKLLRLPGTVLNRLNRLNARQSEIFNGFLLKVTINSSESI